MTPFHLICGLLCGLFCFSDANRYSNLRVPNSDARGPSSNNEEYICFDDVENQWVVCFREGEAPRFLEGEPGYGTQNYEGYYTNYINLEVHLGPVYGHSRDGKVNMYLTFATDTNLYVYSFDYCPQLWKTPQTARFSVYHLLTGSVNQLNLAVLHKPPFEQGGFQLGIPGGLQVHCSSKKFPTDEDENDSRESENLESLNRFARGPSIEDENPKDGLCFYDAYHPERRWYITGGTDEYLVGNGNQIHQYYEGIVENFNTGEFSYTYGHAPRGQRTVVMSSVIESVGFVTYAVEFDNESPMGAYMYIGSLVDSHLLQNFQRAEVRQC